MNLSGFTFLYKSTMESLYYFILIITLNQLIVIQCRVQLKGINLKENHKKTVENGDEMKIWQQENVVKSVEDNDVESKAVCMPMMLSKVLTPDMKKQVQTFQHGWKDKGNFPLVKLTPRESSWLLSLSTSSSIRLSHGQASNSTRMSGGKNCYEIPSPMRVRKEYRQLSLGERKSFHDALNSLKSFIPDPENAAVTSGYDLIVMMHRYQNAPSAHGGAAFLPWHREFLLRMENALFDNGFIGPGMPYWDSTLDQNLPDASDSVIFSDDYMGNNDGIVTSGPAANWTTIPDCNFNGKYLTRRTFTGDDGQYFLFSDDKIQNNIFDQICFKDITCRENCGFEYDHGGVHVFINGHMGSVTCSPSDPFFFLHHTFVDCLWEKFRQKYQRTNREKEYPSRDGNDDSIGGSGHEWDAPMSPFDGVINAQGLSNHYTNYYFRYEERPVKCIANYQCHSEALWCDRRACRCRSKVKLGGYCGELPHMACAGSCSNGKSPKCRESKCIC